MGVVMRPSQQKPYFDIAESVVAMAPNAGSQIVQADAERVYLRIGLGGSSGSFNVSTNRIPAAQGIIVSSTIPLDFAQADSGPVCTEAWFAQAGAGGATVYVLEVFLRRFPGPNLEGLTP